MAMIESYDIEVHMHIVSSQAKPQVQLCWLAELALFPHNPGYLTATAKWSLVQLSPSMFLTFIQDFVKVGIKKMCDMFFSMLMRLGENM